MKEHIEREAACAKMPDDYYGWRDKQILNFIPAADVVPVRHGRWNRDKDGLVWCCLCGFGQERSEDRPYAYCPDCGARMDGDGDV